jgi:hypothetical protein
VRALRRRVQRLVNARSPRGVMPSAETLRRLDTDPEWREERRRELLGEMTLAEIDARHPMPVPIPPEHADDPNRQLVWAVCVLARLDTLTWWAAARIGMEVKQHDMLGPFRTLPGRPEWGRARDALAGLLVAEARRGDRDAAAILGDLDDLLAAADELTRTRY